MGSSKPNRTLTPEARAKISATQKARHQRSEARLYAENPEAWWNMRLIHPRELTMAIQWAYEAGHAAALAAARKATGGGKW